MTVIMGIWWCRCTWRYVGLWLIRRKMALYHILPPGRWVNNRMDLSFFTWYGCCGIWSWGIFRWSLACDIQMFFNPFSVIVNSRPSKGSWLLFSSFFVNWINVLIKFTWSSSMCTTTQIDKHLMKSGVGHKGLNFRITTKIKTTVRI